MPAAPKTVAAVGGAAGRRARSPRPCRRWRGAVQTRAVGLPSAPVQEDDGVQPLRLGRIVAQDSGGRRPSRASPGAAAVSRRGVGTMRIRGPAQRGQRALRGVRGSRPRRRRLLGLLGRLAARSALPLRVAAQGVAGRRRPDPRPAGPPRSPRPRASARTTCIRIGTAPPSTANSGKASSDSQKPTVLA